MIHYGTARMVVRDVEPDDLDPLLSVMLSNPEKRLLDEGSAGEAGHYDRGMLERDLWLGGVQPGGHDAVLVAAGEVVGMIGWRDENPNDGWPWLGPIEVAAARQREGLATEACLGLFELGRSRGFAGLRGAVPGPLAGARALAEHRGMREVSRLTRRLAGGQTELIVVQIDFDPAGA